MTVEELIEVLEQRPSNSKVCVSVKGNTYDVGSVVTMLGGIVTMLGGIVTIQGYNWVLVDNDVAIVGK